MTLDTLKPGGNGHPTAEAHDPEVSGEEDAQDESAAQASASSGKKKKKSNKKKKKSSSSSAANDHPTSSIDSSLIMPPGVEQHYFDPVKGKGLLATRDFAEGETVFTDSAFVSAPPMAQAKKVAAGELCNACFQPVDGAGVGRNTGCKGKDCQAVWCNRECESRGRTAHHNILCKGNNPAIVPFVNFMSTHPFLSLHSVARLYARILLCHSPTPPESLVKPSRTATVEETLGHTSAFASISELVRRKRNPGWEVEKQAFELTFKEALKLLKEGMDPYDEARIARGEQGGIRGKVKWTVNPEFPRDVAQQLFGWEGFMRSLGRANLNMESQGSLYCIHSHLNHSCAPNLSTQHPPSRRGIRQATKLKLMANKPIKAGEELLITYQDPSQSVTRRNLLLWREHIFGPCECPRCEKEMGELDEEERERLKRFEMTSEDKEEVKLRRKQAETLQKEGEKRAAGEKDLSGLEEELRETLGF